MLIDRSELMQIKLQFVMQDYQSYFQAASRHHEGVNQTRTLQVTVVAALIALTSEGAGREGAVLFGGTLFIFGFAWLDLLNRMHIFNAGEDAADAEVLLQASDPATFEQNIVSWIFGNTRAKATWSRPKHPPHKVLYWCMLRPSFWLWHVSLAVGFWTLWLASQGQGPLQ